jgi:hypothetical protein
MPRLRDGKYLDRETFTTRSQKGNIAHAAQGSQQHKAVCRPGVDYVLYSYLHSFAANAQDTSSRQAFWC